MTNPRLEEFKIEEAFPQESVPQSCSSQEENVLTSFLPMVYKKNEMKRIQSCVFCMTDLSYKGLNWWN